MSTRARQTWIVTQLPLRPHRPCPRAGLRPWSRRDGDLRSPPRRHLPRDRSIDHDGRHGDEPKPTPRRGTPSSLPGGHGRRRRAGRLLRLGDRHPLPSDRTGRPNHGTRGNPTAHPGHRTDCRGLPTRRRAAISATIRRVSSVLASCGYVIHDTKHGSPSKRRAAIIVAGRAPRPTPDRKSD